MTQQQQQEQEQQQEQTAEQTAEQQEQTAEQQSNGPVYNPAGIKPEQTGMVIIGVVRECEPGDGGKVVIKGSGKQSLARLDPVTRKPVVVTKGKGGAHVWSQSITLDPVAAAAFFGCEPKAGDPTFAKAAARIVAHTARHGMLSALVIPAGASSASRAVVTDADREQALASAESLVW